jgi:DNA-3-methyladenine glycosylase I
MHVRLASKHSTTDKVDPVAPLVRCNWPSNPLAIAYHDDEWGVPLHDDRGLFEFLILEGAQAGLSWDTILRKRDAYRLAFDDFDIAKVARYDARRQAKLLVNPDIVRNRLKIASAVSNARAVLAVQEEFGSFDAYLWRFVNGAPIQNARRGHGDIPVSTAESDALSKDLKKRGFSFIGTTICYAMMQAVGMVNDHLVSCFRYAALRQADPAAAAPARARPSRRPATRSPRQSTPSRPAGRTAPRPRR